MGSPLAKVTNDKTNMTVMMTRSGPKGALPNEDGRAITTARSGQFVHGSITLRGQTSPGDNLAKEFAVLRGEGDENPIQDLNNTVDVIGDYHYKTQAHGIPVGGKNRLPSLEDGVITGRSLAGISSIRQSE